MKFKKIQKNNPSQLGLTRQTHDMDNKTKIISWKQMKKSCEKKPVKNIITINSVLVYFFKIYKNNIFIKEMIK